MGTRASFWVGNPTDLKNREWLGCVAWDGYPSAFENLKHCNSEAGFRCFVAGLEKRDDFSHPEGGWPFPWAYNIFVTDCTYAFFDGKVWYCSGGNPFILFIEGLTTPPEDLEVKFKKMCKQPPTPAPEEYNPSQPDSIMMFISHK